MEGKEVFKVVLRDGDSFKSCIVGDKSHIEFYELQGLARTYVIGKQTYPHPNFKSWGIFVFETYVAAARFIELECIEDAFILRCEAGPELAGSFLMILLPVLCNFLKDPDFQLHSDYDTSLSPPGTLHVAWVKPIRLSNAI